MSEGMHEFKPMKDLKEAGYVPATEEHKVPMIDSAGNVIRMVGSKAEQIRIAEEERDAA